MGQHFVIRKATNNDIVSIADTYMRLLKYEQEHGGWSNWQIGVYPTIETAQTKIIAETMFVMICKGQVCGSMVLNSGQAPEYEGISWKHHADQDRVLVIHTLCIPPDKAGRGYATGMLDFAEEYAKEHGFTVIRIDTYAENKPAISLYVNNGFTIAGYGDIVLQGLIPEHQAYLEYLIK